MARTTVKATYSLPPEIIDQLEHLAKRWGLSTSQALSRAIRSAADQEHSTGPLAALEALQGQASLDADDARAWMEAIRCERHALGGGEP